MLQAIAGHDPVDPASAARPIPDYRAALTGDIRGLRIGIVRHLYEDDVVVAPEVRAAFDGACAVFRSLGASLEDVRIRPAADYYAVKITIAESEQYAIHEEELRTRPGDFGADFLGRALPAVLYSGTDYVQAQRERRRMLAEMAPIYEKYDLLLTPTAPGPAPRLGTWRTISFWQNSSLTTPSPGVRHSHNAWGSRRLACRCRCSWSGARSTTRRCCTPRMLTKRRRTGEAAGPVSTRVRGSRPNCRRALGRSLSTTRRCATSSWRPAGLPNCR